MDGAPIRADSPSASDATVSFAAALSATQEWQAWEAAAVLVHSDPSAQQASAAYDERLQALRLNLMLQAASAEEKADLERLREAVFAVPSVRAYAEAETALKALCAATSQRLSQAIGLDFAASCATGCCS